MTAGNSVALDFRFRWVVVRVAVGSWEIRTWPKINHMVSSKQPKRCACIAMRTKIALKIGKFYLQTFVDVLLNINSSFACIRKQTWSGGREGGRESDCGVNFACDWSHMSIRSAWYRSPESGLQLIWTRLPMFSWVFFFFISSRVGAQ